MHNPPVKEPWFWDQTDFVPQLRRELSVRHPLTRQKFKSIARRHDDDIYLFEIEDYSFKYVFAHLWQGLGEPSIKYYKNWDDLY